MAYNWSVNVIPNAQAIKFLSYYQEQSSPLTMTEQANSDTSCLFEIDFNFPTLSQSKSLEALALLGKAMRDEFIMPFYQAGVTYPSTEAVTLGAGATGTSLPLVGIPSGYALTAGQLISVIDADGRRYVYQVGATSAAGAANRTITMNGDIRKPHASGCVVEIKTPKIQGKIKPDNRVLSMDAALLSQINFSIRESR